MASRILARPIVFSNYVKRYNNLKRFNVGAPMTAITGATVGQRVTKTQTQFGELDLFPSTFFDEKLTVRSGAMATSPRAPGAPVPDGTTPVEAVTDTTNQFGSDGAGDYLYAVRARNRYGLSPVAIMSTSAVTVAATQSVDLNFTAATSGQAATSFVIYRTVKDDVASSTTVTYYEIAEITAAEIVAGYDGGAANHFRDKNRFLPNTQTALVYDPNPDMIKYIQFIETSRLNYAITSPSQRFSVLQSGTPQLSAPGKIGRIINIGSTIS